MAERNVQTSLNYTVEQWRSEAERRFGPVQDGNWSFVCPVCGHIQSPRSLKACGGNPNQAYSQCFGKGTRNDKALAKKQGKKRGDKADCDWKSWGLFAGPVTVVDENGEKVFAFDFAPTTAVVNSPTAAVCAGAQATP